jgi:hypothetical protein
MRINTLSDEQCDCICYYTFDFTIPIIPDKDFITSSLPMKLNDSKGTITCHETIFEYRYNRC